MVCGVVDGDAGIDRAGRGRRRPAGQRERPARYEKAAYSAEANSISCLPDSATPKSEARRSCDAPGRAVGARAPFLKIIFLDNCFEEIRSRGMVLLIAGSKRASSRRRRAAAFQPCAADLLTRSKRRRAQGFFKTSAWLLRLAPRPIGSRPELVPSGRPCGVVSRKARGFTLGVFRFNPGMIRGERSSRGSTRGLAVDESVLNGAASD